MNLKIFNKFRLVRVQFVSSPISTIPKLLVLTPGQFHLHLERTLCTLQIVFYQHSLSKNYFCEELKLYFENHYTSNRVEGESRDLFEGHAN